MLVALGGEICDGSADKWDVTSVTRCHILTREGCDTTKDPVFAVSWGLAGAFQAQKTELEAGVTF